MNITATLNDEQKQWNIEEIVENVCTGVSVMALPQAAAPYKIISAREIEKLNSRQDFLNILETNLEANTFQPDRNSDKVTTLLDIQNITQPEIKSIIKDLKRIINGFEWISTAINHELPTGLKELQIKITTKQKELVERKSQAYLLTVGESNSGKTTLCNFLLQRRNPTVPTSAANNHTKPICEFTSDSEAADNPTISAGQIALDDKQTSITWTRKNEPYSFDIAKEIVESDKYHIARFNLHSPLLDAGIILADTPGLAQSDAQEQLIKEWSVNALGYIVVINGAGGGLTSSVKNLLNKTQQSIPISKLFFVITHLDVIENEDDRAQQKENLINDLTASFPGVNSNYVAFVDLQSNWLLWRDYGRFKSDYNDFLKQFCDYVVDLFQQLAAEAFQLAAQALRSLMDYCYIQNKLQKQEYHVQTVLLENLKHFQTRFNNDQAQLYDSLISIAESQSNSLSTPIDKWLADPSTAIQIRTSISKIRFTLEEANNKQVRNDKLNSELISIANESYSKFIASRIQDILDTILDTLGSRVTQLIHLMDETRSELQLSNNNVFLLQREVDKLMNKSEMKSSSLERLAPQHRQLLSNIGVNVSLKMRPHSIVSAARMVLSFSPQMFNQYFSKSPSCIDQLTDELLDQLKHNKHRIVKATSELLISEINELIPAALSHLTTQMETITSSLSVKIETNDPDYWETHLKSLSNVEREMSRSVDPIFTLKSSSSTTSWNQNQVVFYSSN